MNEIKTLYSEEFGEIRTTTADDGTTLYCGKDVAKVLGYRQPTRAVKQHCEQWVQCSVPHPQSPQKTLQMNFINIEDLYALVTHSMLPTANQVYEWLFNDYITEVINITTEVVSFNDAGFGTLQAMIIDGDPWFNGNEVAAMLGYQRPYKAILDHVDMEDKIRYSSFKPIVGFGEIYASPITELGTYHSTSILLSDTYPSNSILGRDAHHPAHSSVWINEPGLYSLIFSSELDSAKQFKRWVAHDVLPSIRKYGTYALPEVLQQAAKDPDYCNNIVTALYEQKKAQLITRQSMRLDTGYQRWQQEFFAPAVKSLVTMHHWSSPTEEKVINALYKMLGMDEGINTLELRHNLIESQRQKAAELGVTDLTYDDFKVSCLYAIYHDPEVRAKFERVVGMSVAYSYFKGAIRWQNAKDMSAGCALFDEYLYNDGDPKKFLEWCDARAV